MECGPHSLSNIRILGYMCTYVSCYGAVATCSTRPYVSLGRQCGSIYDHEVPVRVPSRRRRVPLDPQVKGRDRSCYLLWYYWRISCLFICMSLCCFFSVSICFSLLSPQSLYLRFLSFCKEKRRKTVKVGLNPNATQENSE